MIALIEKPREKRIKHDNIRPLPADRPPSNPDAGKVVPKPAPIQTPRAIVTSIAERHGLTHDDITGPSRRPHIVAARQEAMLALRQRGLSTRQIGQLCGGRDHTTVIHALRKLGVPANPEHQRSRQSNARPVREPQPPPVATDADIAAALSAELGWPLAHAQRAVERYAVGRAEG